MFGQQTETAVVEKLKTLLEKKIEGYEAYLSRQKYLAGDVGVVFLCPYTRGSLSRTLISLTLGL